MRPGRLAGVAQEPKHLAAAYVLAWLHSNAGASEVGDHEERGRPDPNNDVIACNPRNRRGRQRLIRRVIGDAVHDGDDLTRSNRMDLFAKPPEVLRSRSIVVPRS